MPLYTDDEDITYDDPWGELSLHNGVFIRYVGSLGVYVRLIDIESIKNHKYVKNRRNGRYYLHIPCYFYRCKGIRNEVKGELCFSKTAWIYFTKYYENYPFTNGYYYIQYNPDDYTQPPYIFKNYSCEEELRLAIGDNTKQCSEIDLP